MLDGYAADYDDAAEVDDLVSSRPAPGFATRPGTAWRGDEMPVDRRQNQPARVFDPAATAASNDSQSLTPIPERVGALLLARRHDDPIQEWAQQVRRPALDLSETTPTRLPDLLRAVSRQAGHLASDPFNALDNNPFIVREWLIVSQVLHAAATSLEQRFEGLFQGI
jgi:hypothetical protein